MVEDNEAVTPPSAEAEQPSPEVSKPEEKTEEKVEESKAEVEKPKQEEKKKPAKETEEDKYKRLQSSADKRIAELTKQLEETKKQMVVSQQQQAMAAIQQQHQKDIQSFGDTPDIRSLHQREVESYQWQQFMKEATPKLEQLAQVQKALTLSDEYGIDMKELLRGSYTNPQEMEIAAIKMSAEKRVESTRKPTEFPTPSSAGAGEMSDDAFLKAYGRGESDDHKRAWKLTNKSKR